MNQEEVFRDQLAERVAKDRNEETKTSKAPAKKTGALRKLLKNPAAKLLIPFLGEAGSGGILPCWTGYVVYTYFEQKKSANPSGPNIAEYLIVGSLAGAVDIIGLFGLTGVLLVLSYSVSLPCVVLLWIWRINKHGMKSAMPAKTKK